MNFVISTLMFAAGVVLVVKGGDWFVDAASWMAKAAKIPSFIIGATIVSFATTMPEMIVSVLASMEGKNDMAVGNAVGSVTANTGLIMAIAFLFMYVIAPRKQFLKSYILLVAAAGTLWLGSLGGHLAGWASAVLFGIFILSMYFNVKDARQQRNEAEDVEVDHSQTGKNIAMFVVGAAAIVLGSNLLIDGGSDIAVALGVPERVIAVTMVAIGTSLPELVTTITAIKKKESHMSVGNILGANIIDLSLILPICSFVSGSSFAVSAQCLKMDLPACFIITLLAVLPLIWKQRAFKIQGIAMLAAYVLYLAVSI